MEFLFILFFAASLSVKAYTFEALNTEQIASYETLEYRNPGGLKFEIYLG
jgi:hypothetical protein